MFPVSLFPCFRCWGFIFNTCSPHLFTLIRTSKCSHSDIHICKLSIIDIHLVHVHSITVVVSQYRYSTDTIVIFIITTFDRCVISFITFRQSNQGTWVTRERSSGFPRSRVAARLNQRLRDPEKAVTKKQLLNGPWETLGNGSYKKVCGFCTFVHTMWKGTKLHREFTSDVHSYKNNVCNILSPHYK